jgi:hypothetical protein
MGNELTFIKRMKAKINMFDFLSYLFAGFIVWIIYDTKSFSPEASYLTIGFLLTAFLSHSFEEERDFESNRLRFEWIEQRERLRNNLERRMINNLNLRLLNHEAYPEESGKVFAELKEELEKLEEL